MFKGITDHVVLPLATRVGTVTGTWLVTEFGVNADHAHSVGIGVTAAGLVIAELFARWLLRKMGR